MQNQAAVEALYSATFVEVHDHIEALYSATFVPQHS